MLPCNELAGVCYGNVESRLEVFMQKEINGFFVEKTHRTRWLWVHDAGTYTTGPGLGCHIHRLASLCSEHLPKQKH